MSSKKSGGIISSLLKRFNDRWNPTSQLDNYVQNTGGGSQNPYHISDQPVYRYPSPQSQPEAIIPNKLPSMDYQIYHYKRKELINPYYEYFYGRPNHLPRPWYFTNREALKEYRRRSLDSGITLPGIVGGNPNGNYYQCLDKLEGKMPDNEDLVINKKH